MVMIDAELAVEAREYMDSVHADVAMVDQLVQSGRLDTEVHAALLKHAWARTVVLEELELDEELSGFSVVQRLQHFLAGLYVLLGVMELEDIDFSAALREAMVEPDLMIEVAGGQTTIDSLCAQADVDALSTHLQLGNGYFSYSEESVVSVSNVLSDNRLASYPVYPSCFVQAVRGSVMGEGFIRMAEVVDVHGEVYRYPHSTGISVSIEELPDGNYSMVGERAEHFGFVTKRVFLAAFETLVVVPAIMKMRGYCYLMAVPAAMRRPVMRALGPFPLVKELRRCLPRSGMWCDISAKYKVEQGAYHVCGSGSLPKELRGDWVVGLDPIDEAVQRELLEMCDRIDQRVKGRSTGVKVDTSAVSGVTRSLSVQPSRFTMSSLVGSNSSLRMENLQAPRSVGFAGVDAVQLIPPSRLFVGDSEQTARGLKLIERLDSGGPVSDSYLRKAENRYNVGRYLPSTRTAVGRTVLLPDNNVSAVASSGDWRLVNAAMGWHTYRLSLRKVNGCTSYDVVVGPSAAARLDCSSAGMVAVGNVTAPGQATVFWFTTGLSFTVSGAGGSVAYSVPVSGSATGPGWLPSTMVSMFGAPYVKSHEALPVVGDDELIVLEDVSTSAYGMVRTKGSMNFRRTGKLPLRVSTANQRDGVAVMYFSGTSLKNVFVAGVEVPAKRGEARVITPDWASGIQVEVGMPGKMKLMVDFVVDAGTFEGMLRGSPATPTVPSYGF